MVYIAGIHALQSFLLIHVFLLTFLSTPTKVSSYCIGLSLKLLKLYKNAFLKLLDSVESSAPDSPHEYSLQFL